MTFGNIYLLPVISFQNIICLWATDCPTTSSLNVIIHLGLLKCLRTKWEGKTKNPSTSICQLGQGAGKHIIPKNSSLWGELSVEPTCIFLATDLFLKDDLKSNLPFRKICSMFPFNVAHLLYGWHVLCHKINCHQAERSWQIGEKVSVPTICFCSPSGAAYVCVFHLWLISNWPICSNIPSQYVVFLKACHCGRVVWFFFSPACWYTDLLSVVSQTACTLLTPALTPRPKSPVLWVYFSHNFFPLCSLPVLPCSLLFHINLPSMP